MKITLFLFWIFSTATFVFAQEPVDSELYQTIMARDTELFSYGLNRCDLERIKDLVSDDLNFYHDKSGFQNKNTFIQSLKSGPCKNRSEYSSTRELIDGSVEIFPLKSNGRIYGAVQTGVHEFYESYKYGPEKFGSWARFNHTWLIKNGKWRLSQVLSYDHRTDQQALPQLASFETVDDAPDLNKISAARKELNDLSADRFEKHFYKGSDSEMRFRFLRPQNPVSGEKYPLVITFHNSTRIGSDNESQLEPMARFWLRKDIAEKYKCFVLAPQFKERSSNYTMESNGMLSSKPSNNLSVLSNLIDMLLVANSNIDTKRIYLVGYSMGASTAQHMLISPNHRFAAIVSIAGVPDISKVAHFRNKNIWLIHGALDDENPYRGSVYWFDKLKQYKRLRFTTYKRYDHTNIAGAVFTTDEMPKWLFDKSL